MSRSSIYRKIHELLGTKLRIDQFDVIELPETGFEVRLKYIPKNINIPDSILGENIHLKKVKSL